MRSGAAATPGSGEASGGFRVQKADEVPDGPARPPSESDSSPSTHSVFGSEEAEGVEVEVEEEDNEFEEVEVEDSEEEILVEE